VRRRGRERERERENRRKRDRANGGAERRAERVNWVSVVELENFASVMRERRRLPSRSRLNCVYESAAVGKTETLGENSRPSYMQLDTCTCTCARVHICTRVHSRAYSLFPRRGERKRRTRGARREGEGEGRANGGSASESERKTYRNAQTKACRFAAKWDGVGRRGEGRRDGGGGGERARESSFVIAARPARPAYFYGASVFRST